MPPRVSSTGSSPSWRRVNCRAGNPATSRTWSASRSHSPYPTAEVDPPKGGVVPYRASFLAIPLVGEHPRELLEALQVVARQELVDRGQRRRHPPSERLVVRAALERVHPHELVHEAPELRHLVPQHFGLAAFEPVRADHGDRAADRRALAPSVDEILEGPPDPCAALPVLDQGADLMERAIGILGAEDPRDAGQPGAET